MLENSILFCTHLFCINWNSLFFWNLISYRKIQSSTWNSTSFIKSSNEIQTKYKNYNSRLFGSGGEKFLLFETSQFQYSSLWYFSHIITTQISGSTTGNQNCFPYQNEIDSYKKWHDQTPNINHQKNHFLFLFRQS